VPPRPPRQNALAASAPEDFLWDIAMDVSTHDLRTLFAARMLRMFAYGIIAVVLVLYLASAG
jgi:hypothetical protein